MTRTQNQIMASQIQTPFFNTGLFESQVLSINVQELKAVLDVIEENLKSGTVNV